MALEQAVGNFALEGTGAGGTQKVTLTFEPKIVLLFGVGLTAADGSGGSTVTMIGAAVSGGESSATNVLIDGGAKANLSATYKVHSQASVVWVPSTTAAAQIDFSISSLDADGFTLDKNVVGPERVVHYLALGGSDITGTAIQQITTPTSTGVVDYTGLGIDPDTLFLFGNQTSTSTGLETRSIADLFSFGIATAAAEWCVGVSTDTINPGQTNSILDNTHCLHFTYQDATHLSVTLDDIETSGQFSLNFDAGSGIGASRYMTVIAVEGLNASVGTATAPTTDTTKDITVTGTPGSILLAGINSTTVGSIVNGDHSLAIGIGTATAERSIWAGSDDAAGSTYSVSRASSNVNVLQEWVEASGSPTRQRYANIDSLSANKVTLDWTHNVGSVASAFGWAAFPGAAITSDVTLSPSPSNVGISSPNGSILGPEVESAETITAMWAGAVTPSSFTVSAIFSAAGDASLQVSTSTGFGSPVFASSAAATTTVSGAGEVLKVEVTGLDPDTLYYYRWLLDGEYINDLGSLTTAPTANTAKSFTVAVGACSRDDAQTPNNAVFDVIAASGAAFLAHLGDLHYADLTSAATQTQHDAALLAHRTIAKVDSMYRAVPMAYTRDDHDAGPNNSDMSTTGWSTIQNRSIAAYETQVPHYPLVDFSAETPFENGIAQTWDWGRVRFIMPDMRTFADDTDQTLLGDGATHHSLLTADQEAWLDGLITTSATDVANGDIALVVLLSSRGWIEGTFGGGTWEGEWPTYQATFAEAVADAGLPFVIFSGDVHAIAAEDGAGTDFTSGKGLIPNVVTGPLNGLGYTTSGPYEWKGVANNAPATASLEEHQYVLLTITDDGTDLDWSVEGFDESGATVMSAKSSTDDTPELNFASSTYAVLDNAGNVVLTVNKDWFDGCSCSYSMSDGTALAGVDYTASSGTLDLGGVGKLATITIPITDRAGWSGPRSFSVTISDPVGATIGSTSTATVTITDDAEATISPASASVGVQTPSVAGGRGGITLPILGSLTESLTAQL